MSFITAQQTKLDLELVPNEKRLEIRKCNRRINHGKKQREPTFQVVLDALALTPCYYAFLTTVDVHEIYPRVHGQNFDELPTNEDVVSFFKELGHTREIKTITNIVADQMHQPCRTFATLINQSLSGKTTGVPDVMEEKSTKSEAESWGKDEDDSNNKHNSRSEGSDQERDSGSEFDQKENKDDEEEEENEFVKIPSNDTDDEDETNIKDKDEDEGEGDEDEGMDYTTNQFDDDVDLRMNEPVTTDEGFIQKDGTNAEKINVQQGNENSEITLNQVITDAHVTLFTIPQKTEVPVTSYSHSSDLASKFLKFSDIPHTDA
uniref:Uncharacterized protein n=1 Tax=Tanacetum cinerariifolium TaxID=118510 RepID=A0A699HL10_TANCI|nr:hypothetical protein [Tanacetum cinerariifolium]